MFLFVEVVKVVNHLRTNFGNTYKDAVTPNDMVEIRSAR